MCSDSPVSPNGPCISSESPTQETQRNFLREMKYPMLRQGYIPIPVTHENVEHRQQQQQAQPQHPCYTYGQPAAMQRGRPEVHTPSMSATHPCRPRSPVRIPVEACMSDPHCSPGLSCSQVTQGPETHHQGHQQHPSQGAGVHSAPSSQPPRPSSTGLQPGYISIPVIHEGGGGHSQPQAHHSQRFPHAEYQPAFHRMQPDEWVSHGAPVQPPRERPTREASPIPSHIRPQSPVRAQVMVDRHPAPQVQHHVVHQEPCPRMQQEELVSPTSLQMPTFPQALHRDADMQQQQQQPERQEKTEVKVQVPAKPEAQDTTVTQEGLSPQKLEEPPPPPPAPTCPSHPGLAMVQRIVERVDRLEHEVKFFTGKKNDKRYLMLEEFLTKELLALDSVDPEGRADVRQARRDGVRKVQNILEELELRGEEAAQLSAENGAGDGTHPEKGDYRSVGQGEMTAEKEVS
ncbi:BAG family molecular chaperone regulator 3 isoform X2 [Scleropages formosus]|uniref:BAG family molecular chaperone regulator 3 isoform X2 n=1 Tax=Scleropages formosus TaxID=113540 RepID=UPI00087806D1|nr:BAG family molecular chaperone regulator 3 isoform X2 [Scleropages formosus]